MSLTHLLKYQVKNPTLISFHTLYDYDKISNDNEKILNVLTGDMIDRW